MADSRKRLTHKLNKIKNYRKIPVSYSPGRKRQWETKPTPWQRFFEIAFMVFLVLIGLFIAFTLGPFLLRP